MISGEIYLHHAESSPMSHLILCLQHSTKPRRRQSLVPSTCFKRFVCAAGQHRTAWMAPPFRIFSMRSVAACQCSEPKKLACDNIWPYIYTYILFLFVSAHAALQQRHFAMSHQDASMESMAFHGRRRRLGEFTLGLGFALHRRSGFIEGLLGRIRRLVRLTGLWRGRRSHLEIHIRSRKNSSWLMLLIHITLITKD